jgi:hypothetical protein
MPGRKRRKEYRGYNSLIVGIVAADLLSLQLFAFSKYNNFIMDCPDRQTTFDQERLSCQAFKF